MRKYQIQFIGREVGAIGIRYQIFETVEAVDQDAAILKLYEKYEHIKPLKIDAIN